MTPPKPAGGTGGKNPAAAALGRKGGLVRNPRKGMGSATPEEKAEWGRRMAEAKRVKRAGGEGKGTNGNSTQGQ